MAPHSLHTSHLTRREASQSTIDLIGIIIGSIFGFLTLAVALWTAYRHWRTDKVEEAERQRREEERAKKEKVKRVVYPWRWFRRA